jgi:hypothetical protein
MGNVSRLGLTLILGVVFVFSMVTSAWASHTGDESRFLDTGVFLP